MRVDHAKRAHNCQNNSAHRIQRGEARLKVPKDRSYEHYCGACGLRFLRADIARLEAFAEELEDQRQADP